MENIWANYTKAVAFLEAKVSPTTGLMNVTGLRDWARQGGGGFNAEGNAIFYRVQSRLPFILHEDCLQLTRFSKPAPLSHRR